MRKSPWELLIEGDREAFISIYILLIPHAVSDPVSDCAPVHLDELLNELPSTSYNDQ
jgi:hypothetical protein